MRRLHGAARRRHRARLPHPRGAVRRQAGRYDRRLGGFGQHRRSATGICDTQRAAVRVLHARHAADRRENARTARRAVARNHPRGTFGQLLPLHRLSRDRGRDRVGGPREGKNPSPERQGYRIWLPARSGYLSPCGGGRLARGAREPGGGSWLRRDEQIPPSPSLPHKGGGSRTRLTRSQIQP